MCLGLLGSCSVKTCGAPQTVGIALFSEIHPPGFMCSREYVRDAKKCVTGGHWGIRSGLPGGAYSCGKKVV